MFHDHRAATADDNPAVAPTARAGGSITGCTQRNRLVALDRLTACQHSAGHKVVGLGTQPAAKSRVGERGKGNPQQDRHHRDGHNQLDQGEAALGRPSPINSAAVPQWLQSQMSSHSSIFQNTRALGWLAAGGASGSLPSNGDAPLQPIQNGTVSPLSSVTRPATGEGGKPSPTRSVYRSPSLPSAFL